MIKNFLFFTLVLMFFLNSCSAKKKEMLIFNNWPEELLGYGEIGIYPDSLTRTFSYFGNRPMDSTKYTRIKDSSSFRFSGDTVIVSNRRILEFTPDEWWDNFNNEMSIQEKEKKYLKPTDSSAYSISKKNDLIILTKVYGAFLTPRRLFLKMTSKEKSDRLSYFNYAENYKVDLHFEFGNDRLNRSVVHSGFFGPTNIVHIDSTYSRQDSIVINSFINLLIDKRYEKRLSNQSCSFPRELKINMIYKDSVYSYSTNNIGFEPPWLAQYFDYKLVRSEHTIKMDVSTYYPLSNTPILDSYPVAVGIPDFSLPTFKE